MRVLFVSGEYPPMQGGVGAYTQRLAQGLTALGVDVKTFTNEKANSGDSHATFPQVYPQFSRWSWKTGGNVGMLAQKLNVDWVHVQYQTAAFQMHPGINFSPFLWRRAGLRVAWTYHDLLVPYLFPKAGGWLRQWVTHRPARDAHLTVVTNEADRQTLRNKTDSLIKIPIGSNIQPRTLSPEELENRRHALGYTQNDLVVAYFGFLNRSKGGLVLIDALAELVKMGASAHLLMIGEEVGASDPTNYAYLQEVKARIQQAGLRDRVQWTGRLSDEAVGRDLNAADVLLMPYADGMTLRRGTLMAGLANGCPIVTTFPQQPVPELVPDHDLVLIPPGDGQAAAESIWRISQNPELARHLSTNARQASQQFRWEAIAQTHLSHYQRLL